ncbi:MAG: hypothetical protein AAGF90_17370 [Pseudomonadota bacterium]
MTKQKPFQMLRRDDAVVELGKFLDSEDEDYFLRYLLLLCEGPFRCREERLVSSAFQFYCCTESGGLFTYFEMQPGHAASGVEAFTVIGLPEVAEIILKGLELLSLGPDASEDAIRKASSYVAEHNFDVFIDNDEPLQERIDDQIDFIYDAIADYIRKNADLLLSQ